MTPPSPYREQVVLHATLQSAVPFVTITTLWLAAHGLAGSPSPHCRGGFRHGSASGPHACSPSHRPTPSRAPHLERSTHALLGALGRDGAANGRNAPAGLRHPPHRTGRAPFKASGSPSDGLDLCVGNIGFSAIVVGFIHPSSGVVRFVPHPSDCPPSPCGRLSRPRTTTRALPHIRHWPKAGLLRRRRAGRGSQVRPGCVCVPS